jgi:hypothetical protein
VRQACCTGLTDLLAGRRWSQLAPHMEQVGRGGGSLVHVFLFGEGGGAAVEFSLDHAQSRLIWQESWFVDGGEQAKMA